MSENLFENLFFILKEVLNKVLLGFELPGLKMPYWVFLIWLLVITKVVTVLIKAVRTERNEQKEKRNNERKNKKDGL